MYGFLAHPVYTWIF